MDQARIGVIGGSGLYNIEGLKDVREVRVRTPFGDPSDTITVGVLEGEGVAFLPRHGRGHRLTPTEIPARANIFALKSLGVEWVISISAVGSLKEEIRPLDLVVPDQLIDRTRGRSSTFFGGGVVAHVGFAHPFCPVLSGVLGDCAEGTGATVHRGGTYVVMEGPAFSTLAESNLYRSWGASVIGMTALPEAKLAREAELCYATIACSTDYDCWYPDHDHVTVEMVVSNLLKNAERAKSIVRSAVRRLPKQRACMCASALSSAIITDPAAIPPQTKRDLAPIIGKYIT
ncbi:MAG: S-methyl-5'-thioadenosine phosphorylase [Chloroflexi bacterium]|nr:S-methyl-5'-thioadenosine phosphorylase [Chloroflexota bacterium]